jgi:hypothetical protein
MAIDVTKIIQAAAEAALDGQGAGPQQQPEKGRRKGLTGPRALLLGAGVYTAGKVLVRARGGGLVEGLQERLADFEDRHLAGEDEDLSDDEDFDEGEDFDDEEDEEPEDEYDEDEEPEDEEPEDEEPEDEEEEEPQGEYDEEEPEDDELEEDEEEAEERPRRRASSTAGRRNGRD